MKTKVFFGFSVEKEIIDRVKLIAASEKRSTGSQITYVLTEWLQEYTEKAMGKKSPGKRAV